MFWQLCRSERATVETAWYIYKADVRRPKRHTIRFRCFHQNSTWKCWKRRNATRPCCPIKGFGDGMLGGQCGPLPFYLAAACRKFGQFASLWQTSDARSKCVDEKDSCAADLWLTCSSRRSRSILIRLGSGAWNHFVKLMARQRQVSFKPL